MNPWIRAHSGAQIDFLDPDPREFHMKDVAFHLAHLARFTGAVGSYSVAEHTINAAWRAQEAGLGPEVALRALHHEDEEAYLGDDSTPKKMILRQNPEYERLVARIKGACSKAFGVDLGHDPRIKEIDLRLLVTEQIVLAGGRTDGVPGGRRDGCYDLSEIEPYPGLYVCPADPRWIAETWMLYDRQLRTGGQIWQYNSWFRALP